MLVEIPDEYVEELQRIDAVMSGRATKHIRDVKEYRNAIHECNMLTADVSDKICSHVLRIIKEKRSQ